MLKIRITLYFICFFALTSFESYPPNDRIDEKKIDKLVTDYVDAIFSAFNDKSPRGYMELSDQYEGDTFHINDIDLNKNKEKRLHNFQTQVYFSKATKTSKDFRIEMNKDRKENYKAFDCVYKDIKTSYAFVKISKIIIEKKGKPKREVSHLIKIDISSDDYKIIEVFDLTEETKNKYLSCNRTSEADKVGEIKKIFEEVNRLYGEKKYVEALIKVDEILVKNNNIEDVKSALDAIVKMLKKPEHTLDFDKYFSKLLKNNNFTSCNSLIKIGLNRGIISKKDFEDYKIKIEKVKTKAKQDFTFEKAECFFKEGMYQKALGMYQKLLEQQYKHHLLLDRIQKCKEADPNFVQNQLNHADKIGQESKKNWYKAFKIYYKYEPSKRLRADQFYFMMVMMLDSNHSRVGKPMGFSRSRMNLLSRKYFYEAKDRGYNVSFVENHIFSERAMKKHRK